MRFKTVPTLLYLSFFIFTKGSFAQIKIDKRTHDYGIVSEWLPQQIPFRITNNDSKPAFILPQRYSRDLLVRHPKRPIQPGETIVVWITYYADHAGAFEKTVPINISASSKPIIIKLKGEVLSLAKGAVTECPTVNPSAIYEETPTGLVGQKYTLQAKVIDRLTRKRIEGAEVELVLNNKPLYTVTTPKDGTFKGEVTPGRYVISTKAEGYQPNTMKYDVNKEIMTVIIKLDKIPRDEPIDEEEQKDIIVEKEASPKPIIESDLELPVTEYKPNNVVFLIDVSLSMGKNNKLESLKTSIKRMIKGLRDIDQVSIITYKYSPTIVLEPTKADDKELLYTIIDSLKSGGLTNGVNGLTEAYKIAREHYFLEGNNQIIIATDGLFSNKNDSEKEIHKMAKRESNKLLQADKPIYLSVVGLGKDQDAINTMKLLASSGKGNFIPISPLKPNKEALIEEIKRMSRITEE